jgi:hypothetical protein
MMGIFADAMGAILSGGATGIFGAGLQFVGNYFKDKQDKKHQVEMRKIDMDSMKLEAELKLSVAQQEAEASMALAEQHAFEKSFDNDRATYTPANVDPRATWFLVSIDFIRGLVRPLITLWFVYLLADLQAQVFKLTGGLQTLPATALEELFNNIILTILYIATTVILWWFGSRPQKTKAK